MKKPSIVGLQSSERRRKVSSEPKCKKCGKGRLHSDHVVQFSSMKTTVCKFEPSPTKPERCGNCGEYDKDWCPLIERPVSLKDYCEKWKPEPSQVGPDTIAFCVGKKEMEAALEAGFDGIDILVSELYPEVKGIILGHASLLAERGALRAERDSLIGKAMQLDSDAHFEKVAKLEAENAQLRARGEKLEHTGWEKTERIGLLAEFIADEFDRLKKMLDKIGEKPREKSTKGE